MNCTNCGAYMNPDAKFCTSCGTPVPQVTYQQPPQPTYQQPVYQEPVYQQPVYQQPQPFGFNQPFPSNLSWKEFYNQFVTKKGNVTAAAVIHFISAVLALALFGLSGDPVCLLDVALFVPMGILLLSTKHWAFALIPTIYGLIFTVINLALGGTPTGIVAAVIGIAATQTLMKAKKAYQQYKLNGTIPNQPI